MLNLMRKASGNAEPDCAFPGSYTLSWQILPMVPLISPGIPCVVLWVSIGLHLVLLQLQTILLQVVLSVHVTTQGVLKTSSKAFAKTRLSIPKTSDGLYLNTTQRSF